MKRRIVLALLVVLVIGLALPLQGAAADCPAAPNGPDEGDPHAGFGRWCVGVAYCVDLVAPYSCNSRLPQYRPYWCLGNENNPYLCHGV